MSAPNGLSLLIRRGPARRRYIGKVESLARHAARMRAANAANIARREAMRRVWAERRGA